MNVNFSELQYIHYTVTINRHYISAKYVVQKFYIFYSNYSSHYVTIVIP